MPRGWKALRLANAYGEAAVSFLPQASMASNRRNRDCLPGEMPGSQNSLNGPAGIEILCAHRSQLSSGLGRGSRELFSSKSWHVAFRCLTTCGKHMRG